MEHSIVMMEGGQCRLACSYTQEEVLAAWKSAASRFSSSFNIPGFRPGHAPLSAVEKQFGKQIAELVVETLVGRGIDTALAAGNVTPVTAVDYEGSTAERGKPFAFNVAFGTLPDYELPDLSSIRIPETEEQAQPEEEANVLRDILARVATRTEITEGQPQDGDIVNIEVAGEVDGKTVAGMKNGTFRMRLMPVKEGEKAPDLDPVVRALKIGETGYGSTICPADYPDPSMRGREIDVKVVLRGIEREELPELTDGVAVKLGFRNADAVRARAHEQALQMDKARRIQADRRAVLEALENWEGFEAPAYMVERTRRDATRASRQFLQSNFASPEQLKEALATMKEEATATAVKKSRGKALLLTYARHEGIEVSPAEMDMVLKHRAARQNMSFEEYRLGITRTGEMFEIRATVLQERAISAILEKARKA